MAISVIVSGMILRLAKSVADTPAISEIAIITPAIGDAARPMLDANCIGNIILYGCHTDFGSD